MSDNNATKYAQPHCLVHNTKTFDPSLVEMSMMWVGGGTKMKKIRFLWVWRKCI